MPETKTTILPKDFQTRNNSELVTFLELCNQTVVLTHKFLGKMPALGEPYHRNSIEELKQFPSRGAFIEKYRFRRSRKMINLARLGNKFGRRGTETRGCTVPLLCILHYKSLLH